MYFKRVISLATDVTPDNLFKTSTIKVRSGASARVQQDVFEELGQLIAIPEAEMVEFVPAEKQPLKTERCKHVVKLCQPVGHSVVIGVFRFESKLLIRMPESRNQGDGPVENATISADSAQGWVAVEDKAE